MNEDFHPETDLGRFEKSVSQITSTLRTVVITFVASVVLQATMDLLRSPRGTLRFGPTFEDKDTSQHIYDISNNRSETLDNLLITVPKAVERASIRASSPITIEDQDSSGDPLYKTIAIGQIPGHSSVRISLTVPRDPYATCCRFPNLSVKGLRFTDPVDSNRPLWEIVIRGVLENSLMTIALCLVLWWGLTRIDRLLEVIRSIARSAQAEVKKVSADVGEEIASLRRENAERIRRQAYLLSRLKQAGQELCFWRDTIRKMLYEAGDRIGAKTISEVVTSKLKTFGAGDRPGIADDFEVVRVMARAFNDEERALAKKKRSVE